MQQGPRDAVGIAMDREHRWPGVSAPNTNNQRAGIPVCHRHRAGRTRYQSGFAGHTAARQNQAFCGDYRPPKNRRATACNGRLFWYIPSSMPTQTHRWCFSDPANFDKCNGPTLISKLVSGISSPASNTRQSAYHSHSATGKPGDRDPAQPSPADWTLSIRLPATSNTGRRRADDSLILQWHNPRSTPTGHELFLDLQPGHTTVNIAVNDNGENGIPTFAPRRCDYPLTALASPRVQTRIASALMTFEATAPGTHAPCCYRTPMNRLFKRVLAELFVG